MVLLQTESRFMGVSSPSRSIPSSNHGVRCPFVPPPALKGVFAGSGKDGMGEPFLVQAVIDLTGLAPEDVRVLYIGTATYDVQHYRDAQTRLFSKMGCYVTSLNVATSAPPMDVMKEAVKNADVLLVSGGNTLYAVERWKKLGLDKLLKAAALRGAVMAGGSAGAICWFDGGHSDSMDPDTYKHVMLAKYSGKQVVQVGAKPRTRFFGDIVNSIGSIDSKEWDYIRVSGLGILPGLVCPHHDRIQSNGVPRLVDFDRMIGRHSVEVGIGIDHFAALLIDGNSFRVLSLPGKQGSVMTLGDDLECTLRPGVWIKSVEDGQLVSKICPPKGKVDELLQWINDQKSIVVDERVEICKKENPGPRVMESTLEQ